MNASSRRILLRPVGKATVYRSVVRRSLVVLAAGLGLGALSTWTEAQAQGRTVLLLEEEVIKGEVQKPTVTLFVSRQNINTDATLELRESFVPRIVESVEKKPF